MKRVFLMMLAAMFCFAAQSTDGNDRVVLAYVTSGSDVMPDPNMVTHICYAFGDVAKSFDHVVVQNPARLKAITELKQQNPKLKVMLSVGGWGSGNFSEMCDNDSLRHAFVKSCADTVSAFGLDGIDIDWEYPGVSAAKISSGPRDQANFSLLMKDLRHVLGQDAMVMFASVAHAGHYNFEEFIDAIDFVNVMSYDMNRIPLHHSPLFNSEQFTGISCEKAVQAHLDHGVPREKIVMGMPFYGHGNTDVGYYLHFKNLNKFPQYKKKWDKKAMVPYLADDKGEVVASYDNEKSLKLKCKWAKKQGLRGVMYWRYGSDDDKGTLRRIVFKEMMKK